MNGNCHFLFSGTLNAMLALNLDKINYGLENIHEFMVKNDMSYVPVLLEVSPTTTALFILGGIVGGIFPDIDNPDSHFGRLSMPVSGWIGRISKKMGKTGYLHRGIFHDILLYLVLAVLSYFFFPYLFGFFVGCFTHCFLDCFNPMGVPILFGLKHIRLARIRSSAKEGVIFSYAMTGLVLLFGIAIKVFLYI